MTRVGILSKDKYCRYNIFAKGILGVSSHKRHTGRYKSVVHTTRLPRKTPYKSSPSVIVTLLLLATLFDCLWLNPLQHLVGGQACVFVPDNLVLRLNPVRGHDPCGAVEDHVALAILALVLLSLVFAVHLNFGLYGYRGKRHRCNMVV